MSRSWTILHGKSETLLKGLNERSVDAVIADPPGAIEFMGHDWDSNKGGRQQWISWLTGIFEDCWLALKPGGHMAIWAFPKTCHWTMTAIEDAGFEIRDVVSHVFSTGFPKNHKIAPDIDKILGVEPTVVGRYASTDLYGMNKTRVEAGYRPTVATGSGLVTAPTSWEAKKWDGWGTALKPAMELWVIARKPIDQSSVARNVLLHGVGAYNIDGARVGTEDGFPGGRWPSNFVLSHTPACLPLNPVRIKAHVINRWTDGAKPFGGGAGHEYETEQQGDEDGCETVIKWFCVEGCPVAALDRQSGHSKSRKGKPRKSKAPGEGYGMTHVGSEYHDEGGASRFFTTFRAEFDTAFLYASKANKAERDAGLSGEEKPWVQWQTGNGTSGKASSMSEGRKTAYRNNHPTIKNLALMDWLCRLIVPPGGLILDPFAGSGSTGCSAVRSGYDFIGIEQEAEYIQIARQRLRHWAEQKSEAVA